MPRREYTTQYRCAEPGCREHSYGIHSTRRDADEAARRQRDHPFRCSRHNKPEEVLGLGNRVRRVECVASKVEAKFRPGHLDGLFWTGTGFSSGFTFGPGFKAFASDFPEGTRLVITAEVVLPDA